MSKYNDFLGDTYENAEIKQAPLFKFNTTLNNSSDYINTSYTQLHDVNYQTFYISNLALSIINTSTFQRLRHLHQLGVTYMVYPSGDNKRFPHCIGTYYIAGIMLENIINNTIRIYNNLLKNEINKEELNKYDIHLYINEIPELKSQKESGMTPRIIELVKIAGLVHDLGHGPFSHLFDECFNDEIPDSILAKEHEYRSYLLLKYIVKHYNIPITDDELTFIKNLIMPDKHHNGFIYQIVSNDINGIDVDKIDYILRDCYSVNVNHSVSDWKKLLENCIMYNNNIYYLNKSMDQIKELFTSRYKMHKTVYGHKTVISIQKEFSEILKLIDCELDFVKTIIDMKDDNDSDQLSMFANQFTNIMIDTTIIGQINMWTSYYNKYNHDKNINKKDVNIQDYFPLKNKDNLPNILKAINIYNDVSCRMLLKSCGSITLPLGNNMNFSKEDKINLKEMVFKNIVDKFENANDKKIINDNLFINIKKVGYIGGSGLFGKIKTYGYTMESNGHKDFPKLEEIDVFNSSLDSGNQQEIIIHVYFNIKQTNLDLSNNINYISIIKNLVKNIHSAYGNCLLNIILSNKLKYTQNEHHPKQKFTDIIEQININTQNIKSPGRTSPTVFIDNNLIKTLSMDNSSILNKLPLSNLNLDSDVVSVTKIPSSHKDSNLNNIYIQ